ncbi:hypothetical protein [Dysgonomonas sp. ZJ279]|uniref:hypothetical protein n=1 Tax=Dysgonomonas sp. ZJ279 TaxID=2709796 RepID=UPI0013ED5E46|nr:hypothetical protein [Dysgonomonas sp. ZJ279]
MSNVSNEALWGKLSEMDEKLDMISKKEVSIEIPQLPQAIPTVSKEEIKAMVDDGIKILGKHTDSHFAANLKNIERLNNNVLKTKETVESIRIPENNITLEAIQSILSKDKTMAFGLGRIRKTTFIIGVLIAFLFMMITFSMKQHADYAILQNRYSWQNVTIYKLQIENDSLKANRTTINKTKKK